ncbi:hypothetical protein XH89_24105 [Bradyrhizobium sp. CCBAU 53340]|uniref:hypothetical protein n=1 Tax=Bradyrhizobium sp. CCBAU 53340 TaxID=1325112 RepID=UPI00188CB7D3|nr:hypothetical protein [Bradyrhizobium sp. CCBAU 53340]QOZ46217.1 hypothetical protein XH89_24105 [Bradyrhizobium sp. CCBAU 53340]
MTSNRRFDGHAALEAFKASGHRLVSLTVYLETVHHYIDELIWGKGVKGHVDLNPVGRILCYLQCKMVGMCVRKRWRLETRFQF